MFLSVVHRQQPSWYEVPAKGVMTIGTAPEGDVQIHGHNLGDRHVALFFAASGNRVQVLRQYAVRLDHQLPRANPRLEPGSILDIGDWRIRLVKSPPSGIEPIDEAFHELTTPDERGVYADSLEERGRTAEATLMRSDVVEPALAARTPPAWRRRFLPMHIEACGRDDCPRDYRPKCEVCNRVIPIIGHLRSAREYALSGKPLAVDPAVRRWPDDLRLPVVRRNRIEMGQPTGR